MKIAYRKIPVLALALLTVAAWTPAHAIDSATPAALIPPPSPALSELPPAAEMPEEKGSRGLAAAEDKAVDQTRSVIRRLNNTDAMTLDDLNSAHQALAKIDALIDLEKHLNELQKLRNEREGRGNIASAIPASALIPHLPMPIGGSSNASNTPAAMPHSAPQTVVASSGAMEIIRVIGSEGRFTAIAKTPDGNIRNVQVGDNLPSFGNVIAINSAGVEVDQNHVRHMIKVKNTRMVFGNTP